MPTPGRANWRILFTLLLSCADRTHDPVVEVPVPVPTGARPETDAELRADREAVRRPGDGGGHLVAAPEPAPVEVGAPISFEVTWEAGADGVAVGGSVQLVVSGFWGWSPPQDVAPEGPGFTTLEGPAGVTFETRSGAGTLFATVGGRAVVAGERVRFTYRGAADRFAERAPALFVGVDADGDGVRALVPGEVVVTTVPGPCAGLVGTLPSTSVPGEPFLLRVAAVDAVGNGPCRHGGSLVLSLPPGWKGPREVPFDGLAAVELTATSDSIGVVGLAAGALATATNPHVAHADAVPLRWADLQVHTSLSDGTGDPIDVLAYARDVAALDVVALTDHDHWGFRALDGSPTERARLRSAVVGAARPGFVPLMGMEWTSWIWGHRHVLFFGPDEPWPSSLDDATDTPAELFAALRGRDVVVIPHHVAGGPVALDWSVGLDALEPVVEVASVHGQSADPALPNPVWDAIPGAFAEQQLALGTSFGMVASTDGHDGHPGLAHLAGGSNGLTALVGASPTPEGVAAALRARATYATNGPRMIVRFEVDGSPMGGRHAPGALTANVRVVGTAPVARVELWSRAGLVTAQDGSGELFHAAFPATVGPGEALWLRVLQVDGGIAWTSPVFVDP